MVTKFRMYLLTRSSAARGGRDRSARLVETARKASSIQQSLPKSLASLLECFPVASWQSNGFRGSIHRPAAIGSCSRFSLSVSQSLLGWQLHDLRFDHRPAVIA